MICKSIILAALICVAVKVVSGGAIGCSAVEFDTSFNPIQLVQLKNRLLSARRSLTGMLVSNWKLSNEIDNMWLSSADTENVIESYGKHAIVAIETYKLATWFKHVEVSLRSNNGRINCLRGGVPFMQTKSCHPGSLSSSCFQELRSEALAVLKSLLGVPQHTASHRVTKIMSCQFADLLELEREPGTSSACAVFNDKIPRHVQNMLAMVH